MAITLQFLLLILLLILISLFISTASTDVQPPSSAAASTMTPTFLATILSSLGFQEFSSAAASANNLSSATTLTIFAPTDSSILTCPSCSTPQLLLELSLPALYPIAFLQSLVFGTKIETLAPNRCLTLTKTIEDPNSKSNDAKQKDDAVFVNGVEITKPDMFNNGHVIIHGVQGFISHLSPLSCNVERMTSLTFLNSPSLTSSSVMNAHGQPTFSIMRLMIKDAIIRLRTSGYSVVSLALRVKYPEISELRSATVFALEDSLIFSGGGNAYLANFRYHVVPNRRLTAAELVSLPPTSVLPTLDAGNSLVVTTPSGGGPLAPMKINYVKITTIDLLHNSRIVVHAISSPFPHMVHHFSQHLSTLDHQAYNDATKCDWDKGICAVEAAVPSVHPTVEAERHDGL